MAGISPHIHYVFLSKCPWGLLLPLSYVYYAPIANYILIYRIVFAFIALRIYIFTIRLIQESILFQVAC